MDTKIDTVLFDLDGTLLDTNELIIQSFLHTLEHYVPGRYTRDDVLGFMGPPLQDTFQLVDESRVADMVNTYRDYNLREHDLLVKEFAGVVETLEALQKHHFKLGIVSTKMKNTIIRGLKLTKLDPFFVVIVGLDEVTKAKPDPEPVEKALAQLGSAPENAIMVGDNHHDILAGKNAGTKTAGVAWSLKGQKYLESYDPDYILQNMSDLLPILGVNES